jgi:hypothetical protein
MHGRARAIQRKGVLLAFVTAIALLALAPTAQAQFGVVRGADPTDPRQDGWIAQVFADEQRIVEEGYGNGPTDPEGDPYPVPGNGATGIYEIAGGHPFIGVTDFTLRRVSPDGPPAGGNPETVRVDIPPGLMPNPGRFVRCTDEQLAAIACPRASQIGTQEMVVYIPALSDTLSTGDVTLKVPLYNMTPLSNPDDPGDQVEVPARFAFNPAEAAEVVLPTDPLPNPLAPLLDAIAHLGPVHIVGGVRDSESSDPDFGPGNNGLFFTIDHLPVYDGSASSPGVIRSNLTFWGVPGDDAGHQAERGVSCVLFETPPLGLVEPGCTPTPPPETPANPDPDSETPFLTNPTYCGGVDEITRLSLWSHPAPAVAFDQIDEPTPGIVDVDDGILKHGAQHCEENVPFNAGLAGLEVDPQQAEPDAPSGAAVSLLVQQPGLDDKDEFSTSHVKDVSVTLPPGMTINPSAANGLQACTDAQLAANAGEPGGEACPEASKIGTTSVTSPALPNAAVPTDLTSGELTGSAYVGQPLTGDKYRLFVTIEGRGISIRLKGSVKPNPSTGQLTAIFKDNPQLPFDDLTVDFEDGPHAPLATPLDCGPKTASAVLTPWSGTAPVPVTDGFTLGSGACPAPFAPAFGARTATPLGGAFSPFVATIARPDRNQYLSRVTVKTPPGLAAMISKVTQCPDALAAKGACPASSRIGTASTRSGAGSDPFPLAGPVYFTGPYKGAPFGMVVAIRAIAGPYDLGTVVVRQSVFVDPDDAHVTVVSDPLPTILEGVPIRLRDVEVALNRPGFVFNPTSCGAKRVDGTLHSTQGTASARSASFNLTGCDKLAFGPKMTMQLTGPRQTKAGKHPGLIATVTQPDRQANIGRARVVLPKSLALDPNNAQSVCSVAGGLKAQCPESSRIGTATAISPALNRPVSGPVYFVQGIRIDPATGRRIRTLPSLLAKMSGEVRVHLRGTTAVENGNLVSTFDRVPDAPVSKFTMKLRGGKGGVLAATGRPAICGRKQTTRVQLTGHNTKLAAFPVNMIKPCKRPLIKIRKVSARGGRLSIRGTIRRQATKPLKISIGCGGARKVKRASRPSPRRWKTSLKLPGGCADARKAKLRIGYPGGGNFRFATIRRKVTLPAGS